MVQFVASMVPECGVAESEGMEEGQWEVRSVPVVYYHFYHRLATVALIFWLFCLVFIIWYKIKSDDKAIKVQLKGQ